MSEKKRPRSKVEQALDVVRKMDMAERRKFKAAFDEEHVRFLEEVRRELLAFTGADKSDEVR